MTRLEGLETKFHGIYRHISHATGMPFYIGRAVRNQRKSGDFYYPRAFEKKKRSQAWKEIAQHGFTVQILWTDLTFSEVKSKEQWFISLYGRKHLGGLLVNKKPGGDDAHEGFPHTEEYKRKSSERNTKPFEEKLNYIVNELGCWIWQGPFQLGRPIIHFDKSNKPVKRVLFEKYNCKTLNKNEHVFNKCHDPLCVNPDHFEIHRAAKAVRDNSGFTEDDIRRIKTLAFNGATHADIAREYNVGRVRITKIVNGYRWSWIKIDGVPEKIESTYHKKVKKPIKCLETGQIYDSAESAAISIFNDASIFRSIRKACNKYEGRYKGYNFQFVNDGTERREFS